MDTNREGRFPFAVGDPAGAVSRWLGGWSSAVTSFSTAGAGVSTPRVDSPKMSGNGFRCLIWEMSANGHAQLRRVDERKAFRWGAILDYPCGKRLAPAMPAMIEALERHGEVDLNDGVRAALLSISAATIDRRLGPDRQRTQLKGRARTPRMDPSTRNSAAGDCERTYVTTAP